MVELLGDSGIHVDNGVVVDEYCETNVSGITPRVTSRITITPSSTATVSAGAMVLMPAHQPHAVHGRTRFKMLLT